MGDGSVDDKNDSNRNPRLKVIMTNKQYLQHLHRKFQKLSKDVIVHQTPEQLAERNHENSLSQSEDPNDYKKQYKWQTISHPSLNEYADWYSTGSKVWPDLDLNPTTLKHWFVCDGSFNNNGHRFYVELHCSNERSNKGKIERMFDRVGLEVSRWRDDKTEGGRYKTSAILNKKESEDFFDYIGEPLPGFSYKWP
jgi:hypothetical protein